ncbi:hypothetical protein ACFL5G_02355 [Candidatus Margulisiibacteriota bacterium]
MLKKIIDIYGGIDPRFIEEVEALVAWGNKYFRSENSHYGYLERCALYDLQWDKVPEVKRVSMPFVYSHPQREADKYIYDCASSAARTYVKAKEKFTNYGICLEPIGLQAVDNKNNEAFKHSCLKITGKGPLFSYFINALRKRSVLIEYKDNYYLDFTVVSLGNNKFSAEEKDKVLEPLINMYEQIDNVDEEVGIAQCLDMPPNTTGCHILHWPISGNGFAYWFYMGMHHYRNEDSIFFHIQGHRIIENAVQADNFVYVLPISYAVLDKYQEKGKKLNKYLIWNEFIDKLGIFDQEVGISTEDKEDILEFINNKFAILIFKGLKFDWIRRGLPAKF